MMFDYHKFLEDVIFCRVTKMHGFFQDTIVDEGVWWEGKVVNFLKLAVFLGD